METERGVLVWRSLATDAIRKIAFDLKEKYSSPYYAAERYGSPFQSVKLAFDVANDIISGIESGDWTDWKSSVCSELEQKRAIFEENDVADPDGYVCGTLHSFIKTIERLELTPPI